MYDELARNVGKLKMYRDLDGAEGACPVIGQGMRVVDGDTGYLVILETVRRACRGCGVVVSVTTNAVGLARMPAHDPRGPAQQ